MTKMKKNRRELDFQEAPFLLSIYFKLDLQSAGKCCIFVSGKA